MILEIINMCALKLCFTESRKWDFCKILIIILIIDIKTKHTLTGSDRVSFLLFSVD